MNEPEKVIIISASVNEETQQVLWLVERPNGDHYPLQWPVDQFGHAMGLNAVFPAKQIAAECEKMLGKTINLIFKDQEDIQSTTPVEPHEDQNNR